MQPLASSKTIYSDTTTYVKADPSATEVIFEAELSASEQAAVNAQLVRPNVSFLNKVSLYIPKHVWVLTLTCYNFYYIVPTDIFLICAYL